MAFIMRSDGSVSAMKPTDLKEVAERDERIKQLEQQCATLAAEIDRMRPVVEAAVGVANDTLPGLATGRWINLRNQVQKYYAGKVKQ